MNRRDDYLDSVARRFALLDLGPDDDADRRVCDEDCEHRLTHRHGGENPYAVAVCVHSGALASGSEGIPTYSGNRIIADRRGRYVPGDSAPEWCPLNIRKVTK